MIKIRKSIFETNSSSVHTMTTSTKETFKGFKNGKSYINYNSEFCDAITVKEEYEKEKSTMSFDDWLEDNEYKTYDTFDNEYIKYYEKIYDLN